MSKQWDIRELMWYGVNRVQVGDTVKNEDGLISKVTEKYNGVILTEPTEMPEKSIRIRLYTIIRLMIKILFSPFWLIMFVLMWLVLIAFNTKDDDLTIKDMDILWNYWRINDR